MKRSRMNEVIIFIVSSLLFIYLFFLIFKSSIFRIYEFLNSKSLNFLNKSFIFSINFHNVKPLIFRSFEQSNI